MMKNTELRERLINKILTIDDENLLNEVSRLLELESDDLEVYILNDEQKAAIDEADQQIRNGKFLTHEEAKKKIDEWLNK